MLAILLKVVVDCDNRIGDFGAPDGQVDGIDDGVEICNDTEFVGV